MLEALGQFEDALTDYRAVLAVQPQDPAGWNNLGNASAGLGRWHDAAEFYGKAAALAPEFAFSAANKAVALFQLGETNESMREMRCVGMQTLAGASRAHAAGVFALFSAVYSVNVVSNTALLFKAQGASDMCQVLATLCKLAVAVRIINHKHRHCLYVLVKLRVHDFRTFCTPIER